MLNPSGYGISLRAGIGSFFLQDKKDTNVNRRMVFDNMVALTKAGYLGLKSFIENYRISKELTFRKEPQT